MVIKSGLRGYGVQLASYLLTQGANEEVRLLDVDGMGQPSKQDLRLLLRDMSLNEQLTRSKQGIYHAIINPSLHDRELSDAEWLRAADIIAEENGFSGQRRGIVLHKKGGRAHAHIAFERFKDDKMIPIDHNFLKNDKSRARMEEEFDLIRTARRNPRHAEITATLTELWQQTDSANGFIKAARKHGMHIANGQGRKQFLVVDAQRSFNLVRHLDGVKIKEVRARLNGKVLMNEKDALALARTTSEVTKAKPEIPQKQDSVQAAREAFIENMNKSRQEQQGQKHKPRLR